MATTAPTGERNLSADSGPATPLDDLSASLGDSVRRVIQDEPADLVASLHSLGVLDAAEDPQIAVVVAEQLGRARGPARACAALVVSQLAVGLPGIVALHGFTAAGDGAVSGRCDHIVGALGATCAVVAAGELLFAVDRGPGWAVEPLVSLGLDGAGTLLLEGAPALPLRPVGDVVRRRRNTEAAALVGLADRVLGDTRSYAAQREAFGRPIGRFQVNAHRMAVLATRITAARALVRDAARRWTDRDVAAARLVAGTLAADATDAGLQLHGGNGYTEEYEIAGAWRYARALRVLGNEDALRKEVARG